MLMTCDTFLLSGACAIFEVVSMQAPLNENQVLMVAELFIGEENRQKYEALDNSLTYGGQLMCIANVYNDWNVYPPQNGITYCNQVYFQLFGEANWFNYLMSTHPYIGISIEHLNHSIQCS